MQKIKMLLAISIAITLCFGAAWAKETTQSVEKSSTTSPITLPIDTTNKDSQEKPKIVLDAGHGGYDSGSVGNDGSLEKDITLSITLKVGEYLESEGFEIIYTRDSDEVLWESDNISDLHTRVAIAKQANADYYVSIHTNFSSYGDDAYGFETYLNYENEIIQTMALRIHEQLGDIDYSIDRGLKSTLESPLYVVDNNSVPALLLELGFLSSENDAYALLYQQDDLAKAIANGIIKTFS